MQYCDWCGAEKKRLRAHRFDGRTVWLCKRCYSKRHLVGVRA